MSPLLDVGGKLGVIDSCKGIIISEGASLARAGQYLDKLNVFMLSSLMGMSHRFSNSVAICSACSTRIGTRVLVFWEEL